MVFVVERVEIEVGVVGDKAVGEWILAVPDMAVDGEGLRKGVLTVDGEDETRFACGTGRRRLRIEEAAVMDSATTRCFWRGVEIGSGGGGEGGGECWYVVALL